MAPYHLRIGGGTVVTSRGRARLNVYVTDGRIAHVGPEVLEADQTVDAAGLMVLPGMVDTHVHLMDPGATEREDFPTGTAAAAARGVTTVVEHTHAHPIRSVDDLRAKVDHLRGRSHVDYGLAAHAWPDRIAELPDLWAEGIVLFKIFTCTTHGVPGFDPARLEAAFRTAARFGGACLVHCEDESLTVEAERRLREAGRTDGAVIVEWRSRTAELVATQTVALLARLTGARVTVAHVSHPEAVELISAARRAGGDVVAEACPQYFLLREDEILEHGAFRKFTPPARARTDHDEEEMWRLLRVGGLHHVSTDHAPATREQKTEGDIWEVHFGLPGLDTTLPLLVDAVLRDRLSWEDLVRAYAEAPARRYGLHPRKGALRVGSDADLVLVGPSGERIIRDEEVISKAGWTPYAGRAVRGSVAAVFLRGNRIAEDGRPTEELAGELLRGPGATPV